jgi:hypothetical protein
MYYLRVIVAALLVSILLPSGVAHAAPRGTEATGQEPGPPTPPDVWLRRLVGKYRFEGLVHVVAKGECGPLPPDPAATTVEIPPEPYCRTIKGTGDCIAVGKGPGVQCVLNVTWMDMYETAFQKSEADAQTVDNSPTGVFELPAGVSYLDPAMALFGLDPGKSQIEYLLVNNKGMPEGGRGSITGNRATFKTKCVNEAALLGAMKPEEFNDRMPGTCDRIMLFDARPESRVVLVTMDIEINDDVFTRATMTMRRQADESAPAPAKPTAAPAQPTAVPARPAAAPARPSR